MLKRNKESSKNYDVLPMLAYMVYKDFKLSELIHMSVLNSTAKYMRVCVCVYVCVSIIFYSKLNSS